MLEQRQSYHHKDLRKALVKTGIELVSKEGSKCFFTNERQLRLAALAMPPPYSHFQNKEELLNAMQIFITDRFSELLEKTIEMNRNVAEVLKDMGIAYVSFFAENPSYFQFLYAQSNIKIDLSMSIPDSQNYKPFIIYKDVVSKLLKQANYPKEKQNDIIITIWAFIHGVTALATMNNVSYDNDWKQKVVDFMNIFQLSFMNENRR